ncbi:6334_t:CDS:10 [Funneliformis mosseae]|uniref:6334_t:CDS:1 n=1 Tax=Funneliformis mosseae TaxID=27381 RepID=A0A9N9CU51_FUNMO|nr:6334_t:CDS:10 [Funneliformis mosseae]
MTKPDVNYQNDEEIASSDSNDDKEFEKSLLRKMDLRIIPFLTFLYLLSFLDRVNIGNAKLAHLEESLGLVNDQYNWCLSIFFVGYILFEIPSNLMLIKTSPSKWIPSTMVFWGITMSLMTLVKNYHGLLLARFFLGVFESGLYPAVIYYITMWYQRSEQNFRIGLFTIGSSFAGSFSGLLAYGIVRLDGKLNLKGWQWLFLIEGGITVLVAFFAYFYISDYPESAKWLDEKERRFATQRLIQDAGKAHVIHFDKTQLFEAFKDWKVYVSMIQIFGLATTLYSFAMFLPSIVNGLGFDFVISQLLSVPPFLCGTASTLFVAVLSDRKRIRGPFIVILSLFGIVGYILLIVPSSGITVKYIGACVVGIGAIPCLATSVAWLTNNVAGNGKRSVATAMLVAFANVGGIVGSQIYRPNDGPHYLHGHLMAAIFLIVSIFFTIVQYYCLKKINKKKREDPQSFLDGKSEKEIGAMGDKHPDFIYIL